MSLNITLVDKEVVTQTDPALRALQEVLIYLSEHPGMTKELREISNQLLAETHAANTEVELLELERSVREWLFRLEHINQQNDIGREAILRRILKSIFDPHNNEDAKASPFKNRLTAISDRFLRVVGLAELDTLRQDALDLLQDIKNWQQDANQKTLDSLRELALHAIHGLIIQDSRYSDHNAKVDEIVNRLQISDSFSFDDFSAQIQNVLTSQNNIFLHYRIERLELQQIILSTAGSLKSFSETNEMLKEALAQYDSMLDRESNNINHKQFQEEIIEKTTQNQNTIGQIEKTLANLQDRINKSQHRISLPLIELTKSNTEENGVPGDNSLSQNATRDNQQRFEEELNIAVEIFTRHRTPYCLCVIRLDNIYRIKEEYGVQARDRMVAHITAFLKSELRKIDLIFQVTDDQYGIILPNTTTRGAYLVMERVFLSIEAKQFILQKCAIRMPVNIGICDLTPELTENEWLRYTLDAAIAAEKMQGVRVKTYGGDE
ncbi:MAG: GGDEF domain-containing protein [bacterium]